MHYSIPQALTLIQMSISTRCIHDIHQETGIAVSTLHRWRNREVKQPRLSTFLALADYFGYTVSVGAARKHLAA